MTAVFGIILGVVGFQFLQTDTEEPTGGAMIPDIAPPCMYVCYQGCTCFADEERDIEGWAKTSSCTSSTCNICRPSKDFCESGIPVCGTITCYKYNPKTSFAMK